MKHSQNEYMCVQDVCKPIYSISRKYIIVKFIHRGSIYVEYVHGVSQIKKKRTKVFLVPI